MKKVVYQIEPEDAARYRKSLDAVLRRFEKSFDSTTDGSFRAWINKHGTVLDELRVQIGGRK